MVASFDRFGYCSRLIDLLPANHLEANADLQTRCAPPRWLTHDELSFSVNQPGQTRDRRSDYSRTAYQCNMELDKRANEMSS